VSKISNDVEWTIETDLSISYSWSAISHWIVAVLNISDYTRFITDMTSETFGLCEFSSLPISVIGRKLTNSQYPDVGVIYIQKGIELLVYEFDDGTGQAGWFSVVVAVLFALSVYFIERAGTLPFGRKFSLLISR